MLRRMGLAAAAVVFLGLATFAALRLLGINPFVRFGGSIQLPLHADDFWVPKPIRLALTDPAPKASPGQFVWRRLSPGFDVTEVPVLARGEEVDRILLARIDPKHFRFVVQNAPKGDRDIDSWMASLCPALVVNGSYYARSGLPDTPVVSDGRFLGPSRYDGKQGAFVSSAQSTALHDLAHEDWRALLKGADNAMVSYPLLLAPDGSIRAPAHGRWLANRSFLGEDNAHNVLIGTTKGAFFSLDRLAQFLKTTPLGLKMALNLDGGPVACQGIRLNGFERRQCGKWEIQVDHGEARTVSLRPLIPGEIMGAPPMPMALAVFPRGAAPGTCRPN